MTPDAGKWIGIGISAIGLILIMIGEASGALLVFGLIIVLGGIIFSRIYWMCPSCASFLPRHALFVEHCHRCGKSIDKPRF